MSLPIAGINVSLPLDWIGRGIAKVRFGSGPIQFRKGARYQLNGEWFYIQEILEGVTVGQGLVLRLCNRDAVIEEEKW